MALNQDELGFDTDRYISAQVKKIKYLLKKKRANRLYIEFGGKLIQDRHSARVLPGYREDAKLEILKEIVQGNGDLIFVVSGKDINRGRIRGDFDCSYDIETLRTLEALSKRGLKVTKVVISLLRFNEPISNRVQNLAKKLQKKGITCYNFFAFDGYKENKFKMTEFSKNPFIPVDGKIVSIIGPGGGSGKFGIVVNQLYHEMNNGCSPDYLKFETYPVHDLDISHPINLAYMAASADFFDVVMRDIRHGKATSYNRDIENYEILKRLALNFPIEGVHLRKLSSATNMGINMLTCGIINDQIVRKEAAAEIARRIIRYKHEVAEGIEDQKVLDRTREIIGML
ncbi:MAG: DUF1846 domain-containing protein [Patescibacteria group bacterium]